MTNQRAPYFLTVLFSLTLVSSTHILRAQEENSLVFKPLFNGEDLTGWVNVNTNEDTWRVEDGILICTGKPIGVMRTDRQYENFIMEIEWMHMEPGGNSGVFIWSEGTPFKDSRLAKGMEVQMLELEWAVQHNQTDAYVHGELFPTMDMTAVPENPRGKRSKSIEKRCKGKGQWNKYLIVAVNGNVKLSINGKFVNGIRDSSRKKGYLCLESEGSEIHFRNIRIMELPDGILKPEEIAPIVN